MLKHFKEEQAITEEVLICSKEVCAYSRRFALWETKSLLSGVLPDKLNNTILVCVWPERELLTVAMDCRRRCFTTILMAGSILLLFARLFYSISRLSLADQKQNMKKIILFISNNEEMEVVIQKLKKGKRALSTEALQTANANKGEKRFIATIYVTPIRTPMNAIDNCYIFDQT